MSYKILFVLNAIVALVVGVGFLVMPEALLVQLGVSERYEATFWALRFFGSAMIALGLILWFVKGIADENVQKLMGYSMLASTVIGLILAIMASASSTRVIRTNSWIPIVLYVLFGLGYAFMVFLKPNMKE